MGYFQSIFQPKLLVLWKKFPGPKSFKIIQRIHFLALEVGKTSFWWIFWGYKETKILKFQIWPKSFFKHSLTSACKNIFFTFIKMGQHSAFERTFNHAKILKTRWAKFTNVFSIFTPYTFYCLIKTPFGRSPISA